MWPLDKGIKKQCANCKNNCKYLQQPSQLSHPAAKLKKWRLLIYNTKKALIWVAFFLLFYQQIYITRCYITRAEDRPQQFLISMNMMHQILCSVSDEVGIRSTSFLSVNSCKFLDIQNVMGTWATCFYRAILHTRDVVTRHYWYLPSSLWGSPKVLFGSQMFSGDD